MIEKLLVQFWCCFLVISPIAMALLVSGAICEGKVSSRIQEFIRSVLGICMVTWATVLLAIVVLSVITSIPDDGVLWAGGR